MANVLRGSWDHWRFTKQVDHRTMVGCLLSCLSYLVGFISFIPTSLVLSVSKGGHQITDRT
ncbi:hypothetical protein RchiOBHm_Chr6g0274551 [Rosa chinensis]|uniref:Uncharacterized protein n=1 Tax=Rosa chinensis TaxID=74649 RepID=A0A2P6PRR7_ROSCH|nr:hypothetical protein RchiOBHm_Chr6g0274551 [Rosa chinensis]